MAESIIVMILASVTSIATLLLFLVNFLYDNYFETTTARIISVDEDKYYSSHYHKKMTAIISTYEYSDYKNNVHQGKIIGSSTSDAGKKDELITIRYFKLIPNFSMYQKIPYIPWITMVMALFFWCMVVIIRIHR